MYDDLYEEKRKTPGICPSCEELNAITPMLYVQNVMDENGKIHREINSRAEYVCTNCGRKWIECESWRES